MTRGDQLQGLVKIDKAYRISIGKMRNSDARPPAPRAVDVIRHTMVCLLELAD